MSPRGAVETAIYVASLLCLVYMLLVYALYALLAVFAALESLVRDHERRHEDYALMAESPFTPPVTMVAPVFNEAAVIRPVLEALLRIRFPEWELIVVNDGSTDETLEILREELQLEPYHAFPRQVVETDPVVAVYRSARYPHVRVVDKAGGGNKAGALNCGINFARYRYVCIIDGDTIYSPDALLHGMRVASRDPEQVIGVASHIAVASLPEEWRPDSGVEILDSTLLSNFQHLEYLRSFLCTRLAWSRFNFMLCAPGAFTIWRRDVLEEVGGFSSDFTCEDIEITFRIHEHFRRLGRPYRIVSMPEMVAKTEAPSKISALVRQRARWQRVTMETIWHYRHMLGRRRYGVVGLVGYPFYLVTEVAAPFVELLSFFVIGAAAALGLFTWQLWLIFLGTMALANALMSTLAILIEDVSSRSYRLRHLARLLLLTPLELVVYRPLVIWARFRGVVEWMRGDTSWGKFPRNERAAAPLEHRRLAPDAPDLA